MIIEQYNIQDGKAKSLTITLYTFQMGKGKEVLCTVTRVYNCNKLLTVIKEVDEEYLTHYTLSFIF